MVTFKKEGWRVKMKENSINFEVSDSCSGGLNCSLKSKGWLNQKSFSLSIEKGPIFLLLEELIPDCVCLFHIGCSDDNRPPSFEHTIKYGDVRQEQLVFSYKRVLYPELCWKNDWFHDADRNRNLEDTAKAMSNPKNYSERITLFWSGSDGKYENFGRTISLELWFKNNRLYGIRGLNDIQDDLFKNNINGFKGSLLDLNEGPLKDEGNRFLNDLDTREWIGIFPKNKIKVNDFVKEIYRLFQSSAPRFGKRMKTREPLSLLNI